MAESEEEMEKEVEKKLEKEVEKKVTEGVTAGVTILVNVVVSFVITVIILKFVWAWVVPDLFPGAVEEGLIESDLTWLATIKLAILVAVLSGVYHTMSEAFRKK